MLPCVISLHSVSFLQESEPQKLQIGPRFISFPITLVVIEGGTGPNVYNVSFDAKTAISAGLIPEGLAILSLPATWLTSFSLEACINDRLLKTCIDDSFLYTSRNTCFLALIY